LNFITGRFELLDRDELFSNQPDLEERLDRLYGSTFRIAAYTIGYTRDVELFRFFVTFRPVLERTSRRMRYPTRLNRIMAIARSA
jgi:hypothetical protein